MLKLEPMGFANRWDVGHKGKRRITVDDCIWPELLERWNFLNSVGEDCRRSRFGERYRELSLGHVKLR